MHRREFLKTAAGSLAAATPGLALAQATGPKPETDRNGPGPGWDNPQEKIRFKRALLARMKEPSYPKNMPGTERIAEALVETIEAIETMFEAHGDGCDCVHCQDGFGMLYTLQIYESGFSSELYGYPAKVLRELDSLEKTEKEPKEC